MSKRIRELIELAYNAGYHSCRLEHAGGLSREDLGALHKRHAREVEQRNAARDALERDMAALVEAAQLVMHDRDASDDDSEPVEMMRKALEKFEEAQSEQGTV